MKREKGIFLLVPRAGARAPAPVVLSRGTLGAGLAGDTAKAARGEREGRGGRGSRRGLISTGTALIVALAVVSTVILALWHVPRTAGRVMWTFTPLHAGMYAPRIAEWNKTREPKVDLRTLSLPAVERRMMAAFLGGLESADLIEVERRVGARAFAGPVEAVGFVDLTDRLKAEGLLEKINGPSFSPWATRGRIFGLPHDVHPVMLGYRADIVEAAGIDVGEIETWEDFARVLGPLQDTNGDGKPDRYLLNMWESHNDHIEVLLLQAGGGFFDENDRLIINRAVNARVLATIAWWVAGPTPIAYDATNFSAAGNKLKADGYVLSSFFPDWMGDVWVHEIPSLAGKMKLMPMPAWSKGGLRTSVWGGTMLGIPRTAAKSERDLEEIWSFAKELYLSDQFTRDLWRVGGIVTPVKAYWSDPIFDEPSAYFSGQATGRMYIDLAPRVPRRSSSPYNTMALNRVTDAMVKLAEETRNNRITDRAAIEARAAELLAEAERRVAEQLARNIFLNGSADAGGGR